MNKSIKILCFLLWPFMIFSQNEIAFTHKNFKNLVYFFDSKEEVKEFFDFKSGDVVADIGAAEGYHVGIFSLLYDSITFYAEDINSDLLNEKKFDKVIRHYSKLRKKPQTNKFEFRIGTEKTTNLPANTFDKVMITSAFHEFTFVDEMLEDIRSKLKQNGKLYIIDADCLGKSHKNYTRDQVVAKLKEHGFALEKMQGSDKNGSTGLYKAVFARQESK